MNWFDQFARNLGQANAPFGFAPQGVAPSQEIDPAYKAGMGMIGDVGMRMLANVNSNPLQAFGQAYSGAKDNAQEQSKQAFMAQQIMMDAEEKKKERARQQQIDSKWGEFATKNASQFGPYADIAPYLGPADGMKVLSGMQPDLTNDQKEYQAAVADGSFQGGFADYIKTVKKAGAPSVTVNGDMKLTEGQSKDVNYYSRGAGANKELATLENALLDVQSQVGGSVPVVGNWLKDPKYRLAERSAREFLAIVLRKDTGAAVTQQEFDLYGPMYLPMPGDQPADVKAKSVARARVLQAIKRGAGTAREIYDGIDAELAGDGSVQDDGIPAPEGWDAEDWKYLTPEEKQMWGSQ